MSKGNTGGDTKIRIIAIGLILKGTRADKPITSSELISKLRNEFGIKASRKTLYDDMTCFEIMLSNFRTISGRQKGKKPTQNLYWLEEHE